MHGHGRPGTMNAGFITRPGDDAAPPEPADQHRTSPQGRSGQLFDRGEESIHVQVQDPATGADPGIDTVHGVDGIAPAWRSCRPKP
jgi:hypothetical protein